MDMRGCRNHAGNAITYIKRRMRLSHPFYRFPFRFDVQRLVQEVSAFPPEAWLRHPSDLKGNSFLPLTATRGDAFDDFDPPILPTRWLDQSPYLRQVLAQFRTLIGRTRLMRLEPGDGVPLHVDNQQYWRRHTRVHVPIVTHPDVQFHCDDRVVHMAAGEAWTFDNRRLHKVVNETPVRRIHLTMDTYGSTEFWRMATPLGSPAKPSVQPVPFRPGVQPELLYESYVGEPVMSAAEVDLELSEIVADAAAFANDPAAMTQLLAFTDQLREEWRTIWYLKGPSEGLPHFIALAGWARQALAGLPPSLKVSSSGSVLTPVLGETIAALVRQPPQSSQPRAPQFERPIFIVAAPRSGSTWLYEMLSKNLALKTLGGEGHQHVESIGPLSPRQRNFDSNRLTAGDARPDIAAQLRANYLATMLDAAGNPVREQDLATIRFLEKTPKNALRIPFLKSVFPDACFIFLHRAPRANISAIMDAWRSGGFVTYPGLPGWQGLPWSLLLIPGWRDLIGAPLQQIALRQWRDTNATIMSDLEALPRADWISVDYDALKDDTEGTLRRLCDFAGIPFGDAMRHAVANRTQLSRHTITPPDPQKWRRNAPEIEPLLAQAQGVASRLADLALAAGSATV